MFCSVQPSGSVDFWLLQLAEPRATCPVSHGASRHARCSVTHVVSEDMWRKVENWRQVSNFFIRLYPSFRRTSFHKVNWVDFQKQLVQDLGTDWRTGSEFLQSFSVVEAVLEREFKAQGPERPEAWNRIWKVFVGNIYFILHCLSLKVRSCL